MTVFETPRLIVRPFEAEELDALAAIAGDPEVMRFVGDGQPLDRAAVAEWITKSRATATARRRSSIARVAR